MHGSLTLEVNVNSVKFSKNYRKTFPDGSLKELARSISQHGIIQPIVVRRRGNDFELIAGDRRLKAAQICGLITVPARIVEASDAEVLELQLVENIQRENVPYYEEALALKRLQDEPYNYNLTEIAKKISKSDTYVFYQIQLTKMCHEARRACEMGELSKSVAWILSRVDNENMQANAAHALRREVKSKMVSERMARQYLDDLKSGKLNGYRIVAEHATAPKKKFYTADASDYLMNWKKYLVGFTPDLFIEWCTEIKGKTDTLVWARAVDVVMTRHEATVN